MAEPFLGEIRMMSFNFAPNGWATCDGWLLPINQNQALFALLGTRFGGNGTTVFALPDYRGRVPIHMASTLDVGVSGGTATHTLSLNELPVHSHSVAATTDQASAPAPAGALLAAGPETYATSPEAMVPLNSAMLSSVGGNQGHTNMQPYCTISFCIALQGIFPTRD